MVSILKNKNNYKWLFWGWLATIVIASSIPNVNSANIDLSQKFEIRLDYLIHLFVYFILSLLFINWKFETISKKPVFYLSITLITGITIGFIEEVHQLMIPGRAYNIIDFIYNAIGVTAGIFITYLFLAIRKNKVA